MSAYSQLKRQCSPGSSCTSRVDLDLNCIKGGGGCHLREKVLAEAADTYVKLLKIGYMRFGAHNMQLHPRCGLPQELQRTRHYGQQIVLFIILPSEFTSRVQWKQGIPIEVVPFAYTKILQNLHLLGSPKAVLRMAKAKAGPVVSDNGNFIIDAPFPEEMMKDPYTVSTCGLYSRQSS